MARIDGRARKTSNAGDDGNTSSSQLLGVERSDQMLLSLIQVRKQRVEFMLKFFCCAHAGSIAQRALYVSVILLRALRPPESSNRSRTSDRKASFRGSRKSISKFAGIISLGCW